MVVATDLIPHIFQSAWRKMGVASDKSPAKIKEMSAIAAAIKPGRPGTHGSCRSVEGLHVSRTVSFLWCRSVSFLWCRSVSFLWCRSVSLFMVSISFAFYGVDQFRFYGVDQFLDLNIDQLKDSISFMSSISLMSCVTCLAPVAKYYFVVIGYV
jgi:hypothetical protein